jgi:hypothetical protein
VNRAVLVEVDFVVSEDFAINGKKAGFLENKM